MALLADRPGVRVEPRHGSTARQLADVRSGALDVGLVRQHPSGHDLDAVPVLAEPLGVALSTDAAGQLGPDAVRLEAIAHLPWIGFSRSECPAWWDEVVAVLRRHGHAAAVPARDQALIAEVELAGVVATPGFALAPRSWADRLPPGAAWLPLVGSPLVRRTRVARVAASTRSDVAAVVAALEDAARVAPGAGTAGAPGGAT